MGQYLTTFIKNKAFMITTAQPALMKIDACF